MHINYKDHMPFIKSANPSLSNDTRREEVANNLLLYSLDPVTSIIQLGILSGLSKSCDHEIPVFDGRRRFNLKYSLLNKKIDNMTCELKIVRLAGYSKKELKKHPKDGIIVLRNLIGTNNFFFPSEVRIPLVIGSFYVNLNANLILQ